MAEKKNKLCIVCGSNTDLSIRGRWHLIMKIMNKLPKKYFVPFEILRIMVSFIPEHTCISIDSRIEHFTVSYTVRYTTYIQKRIPFLSIRNSMSCSNASSLIQVQPLKRATRWSDWSRTINAIKLCMNKKSFPESIADVMIGFKMHNMFKDEVAKTLEYYDYDETHKLPRWYGRVKYGYGVHRKVAPIYDCIYFDPDWTIEDMLNRPSDNYYNTISIRRDIYGQQWVQASKLWSIVSLSRRGGPSNSLKAATNPPRGKEYYTTLLKRGEDYQYNHMIQWLYSYDNYRVGSNSYFIKFEAVPIWAQNSTYAIMQKIGTYFQILTFKE